MRFLSLAATYAFRRLFQLIYHVTFRCNARCDFCFNLSQLNKRVDEELRLEEITRFASTLGPFDWLMVSGGEPFLRDDLAQIVSTFAKTNLVKHITIPTNAIATDRVARMVPEILAACPESTVSVVLSLDAVGQMHDRMRGVPGAFEKVISTCEALRRIRAGNPRLTLKVETVVCDENAGAVEEVVGYVGQLDVDLHILDLVRGEFSNWRQEFPGSFEIERFLKIALEVLGRSRGYASLNTHIPSFSQVSRAVQRYYFEILPRLVRGERMTKCLAGRMTFVLYARGDFSSCEVLPTVGNIRDFACDYNRAISSAGFGRQLRQIRRNRCVCFHPCYQTVNILFSPKLLLKALASSRASRWGRPGSRT